jgi:hypothetical protein
MSFSNFVIMWAAGIPVLFFIGVLADRKWDLDLFVTKFGDDFPTATLILAWPLMIVVGTCVLVFVLPLKGFNKLGEFLVGVGRDEE